MNIDARETGRCPHSMHVLLIPDQLDEVLLAHDYTSFHFTVINEFYFRD